MPQAKQQPPPRARQIAAAYATFKGAQVAGQAARIPPAAAATGSAALGVTTAGVMSAFITWLAEVRRRNQAYLARRLARHGKLGDVAKAVQAEMLLEQEFAMRAANRLATKMPTALVIADPAEREAAVRQILADEERFARQRSEAMLARALAALTRSDLRSSSPLGAFWKLGHAQQHTEGCLRMAGRFWPWAVLDRVHPPRHYGCTSSLHGYHEAVGNGLMRPEDVPDVRAAVRAAAGVMMEGEADRVLAELDVRDRLEEMGVDASAIPFAGVRVSEAFVEGKHPRGYHGRFRKVGDVAKVMTDSVLAWRAAGGKPDDPDAPSHEQIVKNWTKQVRNRLSSDEEAHRLIRAAAGENDRNPLFRRVVDRHVEEHIIVTKPVGPKGHTSMLDRAGAAHRIGGSSVINHDAVKIVAADASKDPGKPGMRAEASAGYGLAALLRHEYGHDLDDNMVTPQVRAELKAALPDPGADLSYYSGWRSNEVVPELFALVTDPRYDPKVWPETVQKAGAILLRALGEGGGSKATEAAAALKAGKPASIEPRDAPALVNALADGTPSSLHKLEVAGHPNLFRAHARELSRGEMPQIPKVHLPGFMDFLRSKRVGASVEEVSPSRLQATQNQVNGAAVAAMAKGWDPARGGMMMVSSEYHVLDGHHRWASAALHGLSDPGYKVQALKFSAGTDRMLGLMREYNAVVGEKPRAFGAGAVPKAGAA